LPYLYQKGRRFKQNRGVKMVKLKKFGKLISKSFSDGFEAGKKGIPTQERVIAKGNKRKPVIPFKKTKYKGLRF